MTIGATSQPVSTLEQAVWWLVCHSLATSDFIEGNHSLDAMPPEAVFLCDMFWLTRENLRAKLVRAFREVNPAPLPLARHSRRGSSWAG